MSGLKYKEYSVGVYKRAENARRLTAKNTQGILYARPDGKPLERIFRLERNKPCHCGSGKKYKVCCLPFDEAEQLKGTSKEKKQ